MMILISDLRYFYRLDYKLKNRLNTKGAHYRHLFLKPQKNLINLFYKEELGKNYPRMLAQYQPHRKTQLAHHYKEQVDHKQ